MARTYELVAKTGDVITSLGSLTNLEDSPSINDSGLVAFVGRADNSTDLLVENGFGSITNLSATPSNRFSRAVQINNLNSVVARDFFDGVSFIRVWDSDEPNYIQTLATGKFPIESYDFEIVFPFPSLNNNGQAVFLATPEGQSPNIARVSASKNVANCTDN